MMTDVKSRHDVVLTELWALKDKRAERYGDLDHLVAHLRALENDTTTPVSNASNVAGNSRGATKL